ncbi:MAG: DUF1493 family protein [Candidatus Melainabacteria bacterium]|nr:MAG: DUF1493 family protein [Candidatus Melainabacteria bacterium]
MEVNEQLKLEKRVFKFVADYSGKKVHELSMDTRLYHDLGIDGFDGLTLLTDFFTEFGFGTFYFPTDFKFERHFNFSTKAGFDPMMRFASFCTEKIFGMEMPPSNDRFIPITIEDLIYAAKHKSFLDLSTRAYQKREE